MAIWHKQAIVGCHNMLGRLVKTQASQTPGSSSHSMASSINLRSQAIPCIAAVLGAIHLQVGHHNSTFSR